MRKNTLPCLRLVPMGILLFLFAFTSACARKEKEPDTTSAAETPSSPARLETLKGDYEWLEGTWRQSDKRQPLFERWFWTDSAGWRGHGYSVRNSDTLLFEVLSLRASDSGAVYVSDVDHNPRPIPFYLTESDSSGFLAVNMKHDFPKRIRYSRVGTDSLRVRIDDGRAPGEEGRVSRFRFHRVADNQKGETD